MGPARKTRDAATTAAVQTAPSRWAARRSAGSDLTSERATPPGEGSNVRLSLRVLGLGLLAALLIAAPVNAGKPQMERIPVDDLFVDDFLSDACGAEVTVHFTGHVTFRVFTDADGN